MGFFVGLAVILAATIAGILSFLLIYFLIVTIKILLLSRGSGRRLFGWRFKYNFLRHKFLAPVELIKWIVRDFLRGKSKFKLFGIWAFTGYFGQGKTLGAVSMAKGLQKKYPERNISIYTNFKMKGATGRIRSWEDLLNLPKNTIVIFDEIQSTFTSAKFKDFPIELLWKITQCRKNGLAVFCSTPVFSRMTIQLRENTDFVVVCKNRMGLDRWFSYSFYHAPEYERYIENPLKLRAHRNFSLTLIASDFNYRDYDTHEIVDRLDIAGEDSNKKMTATDKRYLKEEIIKEIEHKYKLKTA